jgi:signal transduction histidine kinase
MSNYNIEYHVQIPKHIPKIHGDRRALEQVFTNLFSNALEAMKSQKKGILAVRAELSSDSGYANMVKIDVSDSGPGIPPEIQNRIFEPFFTTNKDGTGLGLAITKQIIAAHNGQIELTSFPGGTVFHVTLPIVDN